MNTGVRRIICIYGSIAVADKRTVFEWTMPYEEYSSIRPLPSRPHRLTGDWTTTMYRHFQHNWKTCSLIFKSNYVRKENSRKKSVNYWVGQGKCKVDGCVNVQLVIGSKPQEDEDVVVRAIVCGTCTHAGRPSADDVHVSQSPSADDGVCHKRQLRGAARADIAQHLSETGTSASALHVARLARMHEDELRAGNMSYCQSPQVIRNAQWQYRQQHWLAYDMAAEVHVQKCAWDAALGTRIHGYVQAVAIDPFHAIMFTEEQVSTEAPAMGPYTNYVTLGGRGAEGYRGLHFVMLQGGTVFNYRF